MAKRKRHFRKRTTIRRSTYFFMMLLIICLYVICQYVYGWEWLTETVATIIAIIAAVAFWLEYHEGKLLNEAQFIMELNEQFISSEKLSDIEWELERYFEKYRRDEITPEYQEEFKKKFDSSKKERQNLVNYLVHLEGIAALVDQGVVHLDAISNLMSYRYFIAMNNPIVQELELLEYPDYYRGCLSVYPKWVKALEKNGMKIPMHDNQIITKFNIYSDT